jgi:hypothetical protein
MMEDIIIEIRDRAPDAYEPIPEEHGGAEIRGLRFAGFDISYAFYENLFLFGVGKDVLVDLINTNLAGPARQLAGDAAFKAAEEGIGRGAAVFYRLSLERAVAAMGPLATALTAGKLQGALSGAIYLDGEAIRERIDLPPNVLQQLLPLDFGDPIAMPPKSIDYFSVDTVFYAAMSLKSVASAADITRNPLTAIAMQAFTQNAREIGVDVARDIIPALSAFGGEMAVGVVQPHGRPPEILLVLEVKNKALLGRAEAAIEKLAGGQMKEIRYRKIDIHYAEPIDSLDNATPLQRELSALAYARVGHNIFMIASTRRALEKAIRQRSFRPSSLGEKEDYIRCLGGLKPQRTAVLYVDTERCIEVARSPVFTPSGDRIQTQLQGSMVASALQRNLFGLGAMLGGLGDSMFIESCGPMGPATGVGIVSVALLEKAFGESSSDAPQKDAENLTRIGVALHLYATDFDRFPSRLSELYDEYLDDLNLFVAPGETKNVKSKDDIDARTDYVYVRGLTPVDLSESIIAYSRKSLHSPTGKGRNVLRLNGRVGFISESKFEDKLKAISEK